MKKALIVIDMQEDFVFGALANADAQKIVTPIAEYILNYSGDIIATRDTHNEDYLSSPEGKKLPVPHCIYGTDGWEITPEIAVALKKRNALIIDKPTFGFLEWDFLSAYEEVELTAEMPSPEPTPEERILRQERQKELTHAVDQLSQKDRMIFYRKYYYLHTTAQIASEIGMTERAVEGRLYRIKKRLRKLLGGDGNA